MSFVKTLLFLSVLGVYLPFLSGQTATPEKICLVKDRRATAEIILNPNSDKQLVNAAHTLSRYIEKATGVNIPIRGKISAGTPVHIYIGAKSYAPGKGIVSDGLDDDGFEILFPDRNNIVINGKTAYGIEFGVYEFLERYLGIRWLFPGELGEYIPAITELSIQRADIRQNPSFLRRQLMIDNNGRHENMQP
ncbi:MAG: hypothetical protein WCS27_18410, partial [Victivallaceae bacterium]